MNATPPWILADPWRPLTPPAIVMALGETRSPENLLAATRVLLVTSAARYQPTRTGTACNIFVSDVSQILHAPIPHVFDLGDGRGTREVQANDMVDGLRAGKFDGWIATGTGGNVGGLTLVAWRASQGLPTIAVWKNLSPRKTRSGRFLTQNGRILYHSGHVVYVVPTPPGKSGVYVTGAGTKCVQECPIADAFGGLVPLVEFFGHP